VRNAAFSRLFVDLPTVDIKAVKAKLSAKDIAFVFKREKSRSSPPTRALQDRRVQDPPRLTVGCAKSVESWGAIDTYGHST
jgi:hypothetical protein